MLTHLRSQPGFQAGLATGALFVAFNAALYCDFYYPQQCWDCGVKIGSPFPFWQSETFAGRNQILWAGLFGDVAVGSILAVVIALLVQHLWRSATH